MAIRLAGMVSGMDTDSMVKDLVKAYSVKKDKIVKQKIGLSYKQEAWKGLNTKIYSFYNKTLTSMKFSSSYNQKKTVVSDPTKASVVSADNSVKGNQSLAVKKLAASASLTGGKLAKGTTKSTKLSDLGITADARIDVSIGGKIKSVDLKADMTLDQVSSALGDAGLNVNYDENNQRFFLSAKDSGSEGNFSLNAVSAAGVETLSKLGLFVGPDGQNPAPDKAEYQKWADYYVAGDMAATWANIEAGEDIDAMVAARKAEINADIKNREKRIEDLETAKQKAEDAVAKINADPDYVKYSGKTDAEIDQLLQNAGVSGSYATKDEKIQAYLVNRVEDCKQRLQSASTDADKAAIQTEMDDFNSSLGSVNGAIVYKKQITDSAVAILDQRTAIVDQNARLVGDNVKNEFKTELTKKAEFAKTFVGTDYSSKYSAGAVKITGQDAEITLNGADFTSSSNTFNINGLTITAMEVTGTDVNGDPKTITLSTDTDYDGIYDSIKGFFKEYNDLIKEMDQMFNAPSSKGYEPLTDDERKEISDKEAEAWDKKIKDSVLRRDSTLDSVTNLMKSAMSQSFTLSDGKTYSLSSFGINTMPYFLAGENEKGMYHIDGDPNDSDVAGEEDKLKAMLGSDPEKVTEFFTKLTTGLHEKLFDRMKTSDLNSIWTVYSDKKMKSDYEEYEKKITKWEAKIKAIEDRYYKQFAAMEKALSKLQNSSSSIAGLLGGGA